MLAAALPLPLGVQPPLLQQCSLTTSQDTEEDEREKRGPCVKRAWTPEEDTRLSGLVLKYGPQRWSMIATHFEGRVGKQCRERWYNHLSPEVRKGDWSAEEDRIIMEGVKEMGTKWREIVKRMPGRTDHAIKNRYNSTMRRQNRIARQQSLGIEEKPRAPSKKRSAAAAAAQPVGSPNGATTATVHSDDDVRVRIVTIAKELARCSQTNDGSACLQRDRLVDALVNEFKHHAKTPGRKAPHSHGDLSLSAPSLTASDSYDSAAASFAEPEPQIFGFPDDDGDDGRLQLDIPDIDIGALEDISVWPQSGSKRARLEAPSDSLQQLPALAPGSNSLSEDSIMDDLSAATGESTDKAEENGWLQTFVNASEAGSQSEANPPTTADRERLAEAIQNGSLLSPLLTPSALTTVLIDAF